MKSFELYDFDDAFSKYLQKWYENNFGKFRTYDEMEDYVPEVYQEFLDKPQAFLNGQKPGEFFDRYDDPEMLVDWLTEYVHQDISVPDMLLNRIAECEAADKPLMRVLTDESQPVELRMHAISLLRELDSKLPLSTYIRWIAKWDGKDELTENAVETLEAEEDLAAELRQQMNDQYPSATDAGKASFLSIMSRLGGFHHMAAEAARLFEQKPSLRLELASVLARFGDPVVLPALKKAAQSEETGYLLYIELRNAIEMLGGVAPRRRFDESDPEYESLRGLDD